MTKKILIILIMMLFVTASAQGVEDALDSLQLESADVQTFDGITLKSITGNILSGGWSWDISKIFTRGMSVLFNSLYGNINLVVIIFAVAVLSSVLLNLRSNLGSQLSEGGFYAAYIIIAGLCAKGAGFAVDYGSTLITELDVYIKTLIPVVLSVAAASGSIAGSAVIQPLVISISQIITFVVTNWLIPALTVVCGMCIVNHMSDKADLTGIIMLIQKGIRWCAGILLTAFVGIMTIQCMITPALDSVSGKLTRYAIANFVPVLGGLISDSISVVAGYSSVLKGALGGAGIVIGILICVKPLAEVASVAALYNITSALLRPVCDKRITGLLGSIGQVVTTLMLLMIMVTLMFVINVCAAVYAGGFVGVIR